MAITFLEKRKTQRRFILIFIVILLITVLVVWRGFFVKEEPVFPGEVFKPGKKVEIDFGVLESSILQEIQPFEEIEPIEEGIEISRENPFLPYSPPSE